MFSTDNQAIIILLAGYAPMATAIYVLWSAYRKVVEEHTKESTLALQKMREGVDLIAESLKEIKQRLGGL